MGDLTNRLKKAQKITDKEGKEKFIVSDGVRNRVKELTTLRPVEMTNRRANKRLRSFMEVRGFTKIRMKDAQPISALKDGREWTKDEIKQWAEASMEAIKQLMEARKK